MTLTNFCEACLPPTDAGAAPQHQPQCQHHHFYHQLADERDIRKTVELFIRSSRGQTIPDQWQTQIMLRVLMCASVIYISDMEDGIVRSMHMTPAHSIGEALTLAHSMPGREALDIVTIPDGVSVIVNQKTSEA